MRVTRALEFGNKNERMTVTAEEIVSEIETTIRRRTASVNENVKESVSGIGTETETGKGKEIVTLVEDHEVLGEEKMIAIEEMTEETTEGKIEEVSIGMIGGNVTVIETGTGKETGIGTGTGKEIEIGTEILREIEIGTIENMKNETAPIKIEIETETETETENGSGNMMTEIAIGIGKEKEMANGSVIRIDTPPNVSCVGGNSCILARIHLAR